MSKTVKGTGIVVVAIGLAYLGMIAYLAWSYFVGRDSSAYSTSEID